MEPSSNLFEDQIVQLYDNKLEVRLEVMDQSIRITPIFNKDFGEWQRAPSFVSISKVLNKQKELSKPMNFIDPLKRGKLREEFVQLIDEVNQNLKDVAMAILEEYERTVMI